MNENKKPKVVDQTGEELDLNEISGKDVVFHLIDEEDTFEGKVTKISADQIWILLPERQKSKAYELKQVKMLEVVN